MDGHDFGAALPQPWPGSKELRPAIMHGEKPGEEQHEVRGVRNVDVGIHDAVRGREQHDRVHAALCPRTPKNLLKSS